MVGEIRDGDTAKIAVEAALTGHLVLSTLHTNDASGAISRLVEMKVEPFLVSSALIGVLAQRLARCICPNCKEGFRPPAEAIRKFGMTVYGDHDLQFYRGRGCDHSQDDRIQRAFRYSRSSDDSGSCPQPNPAKSLHGRDSPGGY